MLQAEMIDHAADLRWHREEAAKQKVKIDNVLAEIDQMIADEPDPRKHPLYGIAAYLLDRSNSPGSPISLFERLTALAQTAIGECVDDVLTDPSVWEDE